MYNVFSDERLKQKLAKEVFSQQRLQKKLQSDSTTRSILANRHHERLAKRFQSMKQNVVSTYYRKQIKPGPPFKGQAVIRHTPRDSRQRVAESLCQNQLLDIVPNPKPLFQLRQRLKHKQINPELHFTARNTHQRVSESWLSRSNYLDTSPVSNISPLKQPRNYFKSVQTVANNLNSFQHFRPELNLRRKEGELRDLAEDVVQKFQLKKKRLRLSATAN